MIRPPAGWCFSVNFAICNETFENWPQADAFACAADLGYRGIEIAPFTLAVDARQVSAVERARLRDLASQHNLAVVGLHWLLAKTTGYHLTSPDAATRARTADYLAELIKLCADLSGTIMVFGSPKQRDLLGGVSHEDGLRYATEIFRQVMPLAASRGVTIAFEPLAPTETNFINTAVQGIELVERVAHEKFRLHLDVKAMSSEAQPIPEIIRASRKHLVHFHANDPDGRGPGTTGLDHQPFAAALNEIGYSGWVSVEVFDYKPDPRTIAAAAIGCLRESYR